MRGEAGVVVVMHGNEGSTPRPDSVTVFWVGEAVPDQAAPTDYWYRSNVLGSDR